MKIFTFERRQLSSRGRCKSVPSADCYCVLYLPSTTSVSQPPKAGAVATTQNGYHRNRVGHAADFSDIKGNRTQKNDVLTSAKWLTSLRSGVQVKTMHIYRRISCLLTAALATGASLNSESLKRSGIFTKF